MLIEFSVANFRSFRDRVTLSLEAEPRISERDKTVDERNVASTPFGDLFRVTGIYGANASGKSNLVRALAVFRKLVLNSAREGQSGDPLPAAPFRLDEVSVTEPTEFEVVYTVDELQVRYGAAFTRERFTREWLFVRVVGAEREERWFERTLDAYETSGAWRRDPGIEQKTRPEALHISAAAAWRHEQSAQILKWFRMLGVVDGLSDGGLMLQTVKLLDQPQHGAAMRKLVRSLDVGIDDIRVSDADDDASSLAQRFSQALRSSLGEVLPGVMIPLPSMSGTRIKTVRRGVQFDLDDESAGTVRAIALAGPIVEALATGRILVVDEFDARLHTLLAKQLVELFQDSSINKRGAQLVFISHDTNLLTRTLLRRDQLWFVEKSHKTQSSDLYSLAEIRLESGKGVRNDASYEADYLQGRYGAIPFFGNLKAILEESLRETEE